MEISSAFDLVIKYGSVAVMLVYLLFAGVVVRQVNLMVKTFNTPHEEKIKFLGWTHMGIAILVLVLAILL